MNRETAAAAWQATVAPDAVPRALELLAADESRATHRGRMQARFNLWRATGDRAHLAEAHRLLLALRDNAPPDCRDSVMTAPALHRDIAAAAA